MNTVSVMRRDLTPAQLDLAKRTVAKDCNNDEFSLFIAAAQRAMLDPLRKQISAIVFSKNDPKKRQLAIITNIDGLRVIAARQGDYRPMETPPVIEYSEAAKDPATNPLGIVSCEVRCWKRYGNEWHPVAGIAYYDEYVPLEQEWAFNEEAGRRLPSGPKALKQESPWRRMPRVMIAKVAEAQALRRGWPDDMAGLYSDDEMERAVVIDATASEIVEEHQEAERVKRVGGADTFLFVFEAGGALEPVGRGQAADRLAAWTEQASGEAVKAFRERNKESLNQFWAKEPGDALAVKKLMESKIAAVVATKPAEDGALTASAGSSSPSEPAPPQASDAAAGAPQSDKASGGDPYAWLSVKLSKITSATDLLSFQQAKLHRSQWWERADDTARAAADKLVADRAAALVRA